MIRFTMSGMAEVRKAMEASPKQARFAAARALTDVAQDIQQAVIRDLPEMFTIRSGWVAKGIRIVAANPTSLEAVIGSKDEFMERQAVGGTKEAEGGGSVAVPVGARPTRTAMTRPGHWPKALLAKSGKFIAPLGTDGLYMGVERFRSDGSAKTRRSTSHAAPGAKIRRGDRGRDTFATLGVWERFGGKVKATKGRFAGQKRQRIRLLYVLKDEIHIDNPRFRLREIAERVAKERYLPAFQRRFAEAMASAR